MGLVQEILFLEAVQLPVQVTTYYYGTRRHYQQMREHPSDYLCVYRTDEKIRQTAMLVGLGRAVVWPVYWLVYFFCYYGHAFAFHKEIAEERERELQIHRDRVRKEKEQNTLLMEIELGIIEPPKPPRLVREGRRERWARESNEAVERARRNTLR